MKKHWIQWKNTRSGTTAYQGKPARPLTFSSLTSSEAVLPLLLLKSTRFHDKKILDSPKKH